MPEKRKFVGISTGYLHWLYGRNFKMICIPGHNAFAFYLYYVLIISLVKHPLIARQTKSSYTIFEAVKAQGGILKEVLYWETPSQGPAVNPFIYHF